MSEPLIDKTRRVIQSDRFADLRKESLESGSGCFYYSVISTSLYLNHSRVIDASKIEELIASRNSQFGVKPSEAIDLINDLASTLGIGVQEIINYTPFDNSSIREDFLFPGDIPILQRDPPGQNFQYGKDWTELLYLQTPDRVNSHWLSVNEDPAFMKSPELVASGGADVIKRFRKEYLVALGFKITKK